MGSLPNSSCPRLHHLPSELGFGGRRRRRAGACEGGRAWATRRRVGPRRRAACGHGLDRSALGHSAWHSALGRRRARALVRGARRAGAPPGSPLRRLHRRRRCFARGSCRARARPVWRPPPSAAVGHPDNVRRPCRPGVVCCPHCPRLRWSTPSPGLQPLTASLRLRPPDILRRHDSIPTAEEPSSPSHKPLSTSLRLSLPPPCCCNIS